MILFQPQPPRLHFTYAAEQMANSILDAGVTASIRPVQDLMAASSRNDVDPRYLWHISS